MDCAGPAGQKENGSADITEGKRVKKKKKDEDFVCTRSVYWTYSNCILFSYLHGIITWMTTVTDILHFEVLSSFISGHGLIIKPLCLK